ncbi:hypothetical protein FACS189483_08930 [Spirochaetia bacterium]|nr:hypothetical protein FACS189483_08930 [Spirochaetia bacterium]
MITADEDKNRPLPPSRNRFIIFIVLFSLAALAVLGRYAYLMFTPPQSEQVNPRRTFAERGSIMDRGGRVLALQTRLGNIGVWRPDITDIEALGRDLAPILELSPEEIQAKIQFSTTEFIYLKKQVDQSTVREIEGARSGGNLRGVMVESVVGRVYPEKRLAGPIIGVLGDDGIGLEGIEYAFEDDLTPKGDQNGNHVILTIDTNVQFILEDIARRTYTDNNADAVMLLAMDPRTGDVLGSASIPDFDPNDFRDSPLEDRIHRPTIMDYEPGSVFKIFSLAALLDSEAIGTNTIFTCNGYYERVTNRGERIRINCLSAHGPVTAREIIIHSCNAGVAYAADRLAVDPFYRRIRDFGFGERTNVGNPGETEGFLRQENLWSERSKPTIAMGQELSVSAMQMLQAATAIANDGILVPPPDRLPGGGSLRQNRAELRNHPAPAYPQSRDRPAFAVLYGGRHFRNRYRLAGQVG